MELKSVKKIYDDLLLLLKISVIAGIEYPSATLHQDEIKILLELLEDKINKEEAKDV